jgi:hypothetical protein
MYGIPLKTLAKSLIGKDFSAVSNEVKKTLPFIEIFIEKEDGVSHIYDKSYFCTNRIRVEVEKGVITNVRLG